MRDTAVWGWLISDLSSRELRPAGRSPNISTNWSHGDAGLEEVSTSTGRRTDAGTPSRLSRRAMFARWQRLQEASQATSTHVGVLEGFLLQLKPADSLLQLEGRE